MEPGRQSLMTLVRYFPPSHLPYRWMYLEELAALLSRETPLRVAHVRILDFEKYFNKSPRQPLSIGAGLGYFLGDAAIESFGYVLDNSLKRDKAFSRLGLYNDGPAYYFISSDVTPTSLALNLKRLVQDNVFRLEVLTNISELVDFKLRTLEKRISASQLAAYREELANLSLDAIRIYGGVSSAAGPANGLSFDRARRLSREAFQAAQLERLIMLGRPFLLGLEEALSRHAKSRGANEIADCINAALKTANHEGGGFLAWDQDSHSQQYLNETADLIQAYLAHPCEHVSEIVDTFQRIGVRRFFIVPHFDLVYNGPEGQTFQDLLRAESLALDQGDGIQLRKAQDHILHKWVWRLFGRYPYEAIVAGNNRIFSALLQYCILEQPSRDYRIFMHRGADELARITWDSSKKELTIEKYDFNNIGAVLNQYGLDVALQTAEQMMHVVQRIYDGRDVPEQILKMNLPAVDVVYRHDWQQDFSDRVLLTSPQMVSGGAVRFDAGKVPPDLLTRDFGFLEELADNLVLRNKTRLKADQIKRGGAIDTRLAFTIEPVGPIGRDFLDRLPNRILSAEERLVARLILGRSDIERNSSVGTSREAAERFGYDYIIVSCSSDDECNYWGQRLERSHAWFMKNTAKVLTVRQSLPRGSLGPDWGMLSAFRNARHQYLKRSSGTDLLEELRKGRSIAVYNTAGLGTRMFPIGLVENLSKSDVKLPHMLNFNNSRKSFQPLRVLEAVIMSTAIFAPARGGRLSVFHTDQLVFPDNDVSRPVIQHIEIFSRACVLDRADSRQGLLLSGRQNDVLRYIPAGWDLDNVQRLIERDSHRGLRAVHSLGSYSISVDLLVMLLRLCPLDSPRLMLLYKLPLVPALVSLPALRFLLPGAGSPWVAHRDLGAASVLWDFGHVKNYRDYLLKVVESSTDGDVARQFLGISTDTDLTHGSRLDNVESSSSLIHGSRISTGRIVNSVVIDSECDHVDIENTILIGSCVGKLEARGGIVYHAVREKLNAQENAVVDFFPFRNRKIQVQVPLDEPQSAFLSSVFIKPVECASFVPTDVGSPFLGQFDDSGRGLRERLLEILSSRDDVSLVMLKGGALGGLRLHDRILGQLSQDFQIFHGSIHRLSARDVFLRWRSSPSCAHLLCESPDVSQLGDDIPADDAGVRRWLFERTLPGELSRALLFSIDYLTSLSQQLLLVRITPWTELFEKYEAKSKAVLKLTEQDRVKVCVVGAADPFLAARTTLRGGLIRNALEAGLFDRLKRHADSRGLRDWPLLATLANAVHAAGASELQREISLLCLQDRRIFLRALTNIEARSSSEHE